MAYHQVPVDPRLGPNPQRQYDLKRPGILLPKVFIIYAHNPNLYRQVLTVEERLIRNPGRPLKEVEDEFIAEYQRLALDNTEKEAIIQQKKLVCQFAKFWETVGVAVSYEALLDDHGTINVLEWCLRQIEDSDYIILVVTDSLRPFLSDDVPNEKEPIFAGQSLNTLLSKNEKMVFPVFLNQVKNTALLPVGLQMSTHYEIRSMAQPPYFDVEQPDLKNLYAILTKQTLNERPQATGAIKLQPQRRRIGAGVVKAPPQHPPSGSNFAPNPMETNFRHRQMYDALSRNQQRLINETILALIGKEGFLIHWREIARLADFTQGEIGHFEAGDDDRERCYQMLTAWSGKRLSTVASLANIVYKQYKNAVLLELLNDVVYGVRA